MAIKFFKFLKVTYDRGLNYVIDHILKLVDHNTILKAFRKNSTKNRVIKSVYQILHCYVICIHRVLSDRENKNSDENKNYVTRRKSE